MDDQETSVLRFQKAGASRVICGLSADIRANVSTNIATDRKFCQRL